MSLYNLKNPAVKRLMKEAEELRNPTEEYYAQPIEDNLFEWHFTIRGPPNSEFEGGIYHGRITLPHDYPMKPPSIILLTPNGRFETNKKICLSISGHHPESWQPSWSIRTALLAIIGFLPTHGNGAIGSLDYTPEERKHLALKSQDWKCPECGYIKGCLKTPEAGPSNVQDAQETEAAPLLSGEGNIDVEKTVAENLDEAVTEKSDKTVAEKTEEAIAENSGETIAEKVDETVAKKTEPLIHEKTDSSAVENTDPYNKDVHYSEISDMDSINTNSVKEHFGNTSNSISETEIAQNENLPVVRQRSVVSSGLSEESVPSDNVRSEQSTNVKRAQNYGSLVMIWVISVILFILIVRRWLSSDNSV